MKCVHNIFKIRPLFISLVIIVSTLKADDPYAAWNKAVEPFQPIGNREVLGLSEQQIEAIPSDLNLSSLKVLDLSGNQIEHVDVKDIVQFPNLQRLSLSRNPIEQYEVNTLKRQLQATHPRLTIFSSDVGPHNKKDSSGLGSKAKKVVGQSQLRRS